MIRTLRERRVYENRFVTVYDDDVAFADDSRGRYLRIVESEGRPGVAMLASHAGRFAQVLTYRYPTRSWEWGIPRGFAAGVPLYSAELELKEELGAAPDTLEAIGAVTPNSGLLASTVHLFHATYSELPGAPDGTREVADVRWLTAAELMAGIAAGEITDSFTHCALLSALARGIIGR
ncbi:NUDIX hydrolase [Winogradskya humida]|uniref:ADP-ribose pyrophosphatase n=1 Tax=Winogradskya humida TaxID=113566 RepID=A0ABQ4A0V5_9ACTN|nr:NUDIX hydrolase [Actinoplanes humidus]GIE23992.1 hypothetical protein Ahu01nite_070940 [Actinoplanes humidus]